MTTAAPSTALATIQPVFTDAERLALAGFLAGYRGLTREAYALDLRQFTTWCRARSLALFAVRRADIESFARELEARGRARATVTRRLCTIAGFYRYAVHQPVPARHHTCSDAFSKVTIVGLDPDRFPDDARPAPGILAGLLGRTGPAGGQDDPVRFGLAVSRGTAKATNCMRPIGGGSV